MKNLFFTLFLLFSLSIQAQNWSPAGAKWNYSYAGFFTGYVAVSYVGDTLIEGQNAKKLSKSYHGLGWGMGIVVDTFGVDYTYENNGVVYIRYQNQWDTLYNFQAQVGEDWRMAKESFLSICPPNSRLIVAATGTKIINNQTLKYLVVDFTNPDLSPTGFKDTIVENIGFIGSYFLPYDQCDGAVDGNEGGPFRCYSDNNFPSYQANYTGDCEYIVGIEELASTFVIYPNPVANELFIPADIRAEYTFFRIYSADGKIQESGGLNNAIQIGELPDGTYILEVTNETSRRFARLIKKG